MDASPGQRPATATPAGRYGPADTPARRRRTAWLLGGTGVVGTAAVVAFAVATAEPPVSWRDVGYAVDGDRSVEVVFDVIRADPADPVVCRVQALNRHYAQVGVVDLEIGPGERSAERQRVTLQTAETAVTGVVDTCRVLDD